MGNYKEFKYLGIRLDERCPWKVCVKKNGKKIKKKKVVNLLSAASGEHKALMRSSVDNGSFV